MTREERLRAVCQSHDVEITEDASAWTYSGQEDVAAYFYGDPDDYFGDSKKPIQTWAAVTVSPNEDFVYIKADYETLEEACRAATEYVDDDIFSEVPLFVINLDTGEEHIPVWRSVQWQQNKPPTFRPSPELADAWKRFQAGQEVTPSELRRLDEERADWREEVVGS
jgi:hypothetical protein